MLHVAIPHLRVRREVRSYRSLWSGILTPFIGCMHMKFGIRMTCITSRSITGMETLDAEIFETQPFKDIVLVELCKQDNLMNGVTHSSTSWDAYDWNVRGKCLLIDSMYLCFWQETLHTLKRNLPGWRVRTLIYLPYLQNGPASGPSTHGSAVEFRRTQYAL